MASAAIFFDIFARDRNAGKTFDKLSSKLKAFAVVGGAALGALAVKIGKDSIGIASDTAEAMSKVDVVFGDSAKIIKDFADTSAKAFGTSKREALSAAGTFGNLLVALKLPQKEAAIMSKRMVELAADMGSFNNVPTAEALDAIRSGLVGETEPLKRFGVNLNDATLKAKAMAMGLDDGKGVLDANVKAQAAYAIILEQTATAQGDFARTSDGLENSQKILRARLDDVTGRLGTKLLPIMTKVVEIGVKVVDFTEKHSDILGPLAVALGAATAAMWAFNIAAAANPIGLVVAAIAAMVAGLVVAYQKVDWFRTGVDKAFGGLKTALIALTGPFGLIVSQIIRHWDTIKGAATGVAKWVVDKFGTITAFFKGLPEAFSAALSRVEAMITAPFRAAFNAIKRLWNSTVGGFGFEVPGWLRVVPQAGGIAGKSFRIPRMAHGSLSAPPGFALVGEQGPEIVAMRGGERVHPAAQTAAMGGGVHVHIHGHALASKTEIARIVQDALIEAKRLGGAVA